MNDRLASQEGCNPIPRRRRRAAGVDDCIQLVMKVAETGDEGMKEEYTKHIRVSGKRTSIQ